MKCNNCKKEIKDGEDYYTVYRKVLCISCLKKAYGVKEPIKPPKVKGKGGSIPQTN